jgi:hypothetical protein
MNAVAEGSVQIPSVDKLSIILAEKQRDLAKSALCEGESVAQQKKPPIPYSPAPGNGGFVLGGWPKPNIRVMKGKLAGREPGRRPFTISQPFRRNLERRRRRPKYPPSREEQDSEPGRFRSDERKGEIRMPSRPGFAPLLCPW